MTETDTRLSFDDLADTYGGEASTRHGVRRRGRPKLAAKVRNERVARRKNFGKHLKKLREDAGLSVLQASEAAEIASTRNLAQYESGTSLPPGNVLVELARIYGTCASTLAKYRLKQDDPVLHDAIFEEEQE